MRTTILACDRCGIERVIGHDWSDGVPASWGRLRLAVYGEDEKGVKSTVAEICPDCVTIIQVAVTPSKPGGNDAPMAGNPVTPATLL